MLACAQVLLRCDRSIEAQQVGGGVGFGVLAWAMAYGDAVGVTPTAPHGPTRGGHFFFSVLCSAQYLQVSLPALAFVRAQVHAAVSVCSVPL